MKVEQWQLAQLRPYEHNPRLNDEAVDVVAASIREFGFRQPIVVDEDGVIIVGHTRYKAAQKLGLDKVPVHVAKGLTPEQIKAYRIADNKTSEIAEWNYELLPLELSQLKDANFDQLVCFCPARVFPRNLGNVQQECKGQENQGQNTDFPLHCKL